MSFESLASNISCNNSTTTSPAFFRRLNRPPQVQLTASASRSASNIDLKSIIDNLPLAKEDYTEIIDFKDQDLSVVGTLGAGAGKIESLNIKGGSVLKVIYKPSGMVLAKKVFYIIINNSDDSWGIW
jgi:hypothetical protein